MAYPDQESEQDTQPEPETDEGEIFVAETNQRPTAGSLTMLYLVLDQDGVITGHTVAGPDHQDRARDFAREHGGLVAAVPVLYDYRGGGDG